MHVSHEWRVFGDGHRVVEKGMDSTPAVFTTLQVYGFYWVMPFIVALERAQTVGVKHPSGYPWRFVFRLDYGQARRRQSRLRSARLVILPQVGRLRIPSIKLRADSPLSTELLGRYLEARL